MTNDHPRHFASESRRAAAPKVVDILSPNTFCLPDSYTLPQKSRNIGQHETSIKQGNIGPSQENNH
jgi:hypothetical protein